VFTESKRVLAKSEISIFPNPSNGKIEFNLPENGTMELYTFQGELIMAGPVAKGLSKLDLSRLKKGLYLAKFQLGNENVTKKVILGL